MAAVVVLTALFHNSFFNIQFAASHTLQHAQSTAHHATIAEDISDMVVVIALGLGALVQTLITRITGGVFYQISDMAARSVGTLEFDMGENSFKNPGSLSRYIGVHVGRVASHAANVFETFLTSIAIVIIITIAVTVKYPGIPAHQEILVLLHIVAIASAAALVSLIAIRYLPKVKDPTILFVIAYLIFAALTGAGTYFLLFKNQLMLPGAMSSVLFGLLLGLIGIGISYGFSRRQSRSVQHGIQSGDAGVLQVIIGSLSKGMFASVIITVIIVFVVLLSYDRIGGSEVLLRGVYDIVLVAVSAVFSLGILSAFNAMALMSEAVLGMSTILGYPEQTKQWSREADSEGSAISTAVDTILLMTAAITSFSFVVIYIRKSKYWISHLVSNGVTKFGHRTFTDIIGHPVHTHTGSLTTHRVIELYNLNVINPDILGGIFLGGCAAFLISGSILILILKGAAQLINAIRGELHDNQAIWDGKALPDYAKFVMIGAKYSRKYLLALIAQCAIFPLISGLFWGVSGVSGFLLGMIGTGFLLSFLYVSAGGIWVAARKAHSLTNSDTSSPIHINLTVGEGIGAIFKEALAPLLSAAIKLMSLISLASAGLALMSAIFLL